METRRHRTRITPVCGGVSPLTRAAAAAEAAAAAAADTVSVHIMPAASNAAGFYCTVYGHR
jgi:hypothetical protein